MTTRRILLIWVLLVAFLSVWYGGAYTMRRVEHQYALQERACSQNPRYCFEVAQPAIRGSEHSDFTSAVADALERRRAAQ